MVQYVKIELRSEAYQAGQTGAFIEHRLNATIYCCRLG